MAIHDGSGGVPRTINVIGENALLTGFGAGQRPIGLKIVLEVCADLDLVSASTAARAPRAPTDVMPMPVPARRAVSTGALPVAEVPGPRSSSFPYLRWGRR